MRSASDLWWPRSTAQPPGARSSPMGMAPSTCGAEPSPRTVTFAPIRALHLESPALRKDAMRNWFKRARRQVAAARRGQTLVETALILVLLSLVGIGALLSLRNVIVPFYSAANA